MTVAEEIQAAVRWLRAQAVKWRDRKPARVAEFFDEAADDLARLPWPPPNWPAILTVR